MRKIVMQKVGTKEPVIVQYDETAPCLICGNPVIYPSMGGLDVCPSCDCGYWRDGTKMTLGKDDAYLFKHAADKKEQIPMFKQYDDIAIVLEAHGYNLDLWNHLKEYLHTLEESDELEIKERFSGKTIPEMITMPLN
jgi:hypothetical protein